MTRLLLTNDDGIASPGSRIDWTTAPVSPPKGPHTMGWQSSDCSMRATHTPWPPAWRCTSSEPEVRRSTDTVSTGVGANTTTPS
jgi:hypothetical protein